MNVPYPCRSAAAALLGLLFAMPGATPRAHAMASQTRMPEAVAIEDVDILGHIEGENLSITVECTVLSTGREPVEFPLIRDTAAVLLEAPAPDSPVQLLYDPEQHHYAVRIEKAGEYRVAARFAVRPDRSEDPWRSAEFKVPRTGVRRLEVVCDQEDMEVRFPGGMRVTRTVHDGSLHVQALLGPNAPCAIRWKPRLEDVEADLVLAVESHATARVSTGALHLQTHFDFAIAQGKLRELVFTVPPSLSVTQVQGADIRDWRLAPAEPGEARTLTVILSTPQVGAYPLAVHGETILADFPLKVDLPVVAPREVIRSGGYLSVGTASAIQLVVHQTGGLSQIDASRFPHRGTGENEPAGRPTDAKPPQPRVSGKTFYFMYPASPYQMTLSLADIVPSYDAMHKLVVQVNEDDLAADATVELDIRDAPIRHVVFDAPVGLTPAAVTGPQVDDFAVTKNRDNEELLEVRVNLKEPCQGRTVIDLRYELGRSPLDAVTELRAATVRGAKSERGYIVIATEGGVQLPRPETEGLRNVHTGSIPMRVANAQLAYRFRSGDWSLRVQPTTKPASILVEAFHLVSIGEGVAYCSVVFNYFITGAPVDELRFTVPETLGDVEFVGSDVRSTRREEDAWVVKLHRKVIGDYNLGVFYNQRYTEGSPILVGGVAAQQAETQYGFIALASHLNLRLGEEQDSQGLFAVEREEVPANYRLLVNAPILASYKYVSAPHTGRRTINAFPRSDTLPAVVELTDVSTHVNVSDQGEPQSVTRIRYKIKNLSEQFLSVRMPPGYTYLTTRRIEIQPNGQRIATPVKARQDKETGICLIPLQRPRNQDQPLTLELEYGLLHDTLDWDGGFALEAPKSLLQSTFARWQVSAPAKWSILPPENVAAGMIPSQPALREDRVRGLWEAVANDWERALERWIESIPAYVVLGVAGLLFVLGLVFRRQRVVKTAVLLLAGCVLWIGILAAREGGRTFHIDRDPHAGPAAHRVLTFTRATNLDESRPLSIAARLVPSWRRDLILPEAAIAGIGGILLLLAGCFGPRGLRLLCRALGLAGLLYTSAMLPDAAPVLAHLFAWGVPGILVLGVGRWWLRPVPPRPRRDHPDDDPETGHEPPDDDDNDGPRRTPRSPEELERALDELLSPPPAFPEPEPKAEEPVEPEPESESDESDASSPPSLPNLCIPLLLLCGLAVADEGETLEDVLPVEPALPAIVAEDVACRIQLEEDCISVAYTIAVTAEEPCRLPFAFPEGVLLESKLPSDRRTGEDLIILQDDGLELTAEGIYSLDLSYLVPRHPERLRDAPGTFTAPLPTALVNQVTFHVPRTGYRIRANDAIRLVTRETPEASTAEAAFAPGASATFHWEPRVGPTRRDKPSYYADVVSVMFFDAGIAEGRHAVGLRVAQGTLEQVSIAIPANQTATAVAGAHVASWRFNPASHEVEVWFDSAVSGRETVLLVTQATAGDPPYEIQVRAPQVNGSEHQRTMAGLAAGKAVHLDVQRAPQAMNVADFLRDADQLTAQGYLDPSQVRHAYRPTGSGDAVSLTILEVQPEIRVVESAGFDVGDDRLLYTGALAITVAKAGVFSIDLTIPTAYDIDDLSGPHVSHWDEEDAGDNRLVHVHFRQRLQGDTSIRVTLSRPEAQMPEEIRVPRIGVGRAVRHTGTLSVSADRGVRLSVDKPRSRGITDADVRSARLRREGGLQFRLLKPDWQLVLLTEVLKPRINVEFLHVARVSEGLVRHRHYLRYSLHNAGEKLFTFRVPPNALGVQVIGPDVSRRRPLDEADGLWQVELARKWFDRPYPLTITYETRFDRTTGRVPIRTARAENVDLQRGYLAVYSTERVELTPVQDDPSLQPTDARHLPLSFGGGDLSDAAFCFRCSRAEVEPEFQATRHDAAQVLEAHVDRVRIDTVVTGSGETLTHANLYLRVGGKRYLQTSLPPGAKVWSLHVNNRPTAPSRREDGSGVLLVPLAQAVTTETPVVVDLMYVTPTPAHWRTVRADLAGPTFDLPLKNIQWNVYAPPNLEYHTFGGTLLPDDKTVEQRIVQQYDLDTYVAQVDAFNDAKRRKAEQLQDLGNDLARQGRQYEAKVALQEAYDNSYGDAALNEDARVQLHQLIKKQAVVGLVTRRSTLRDNYRQQSGEAVSEPNAAPNQQFNNPPDAGTAFNLEQAESIESSLSQADTANLDSITNRMIETQEAAHAPEGQLTITMPARGRLLRFQRDLLVEPNADLRVEFEVEEVHPAPMTARWGILAAAAVAIAMCTILLDPARRRTPEPETEAPAARAA